MKRLTKSLLYRLTFIPSERIYLYRLQGLDKPYYENVEIGPINLTEKIKRTKEGGFFEWPNLVALNQACSTLINGEKKIVNIGSGTGILEKHLHVDSSLKIVSSELDDESRNWSIKNRSFKNVTYVGDDMKDLLKKYNKFDVAFCVEVIEHIKNYGEFLGQFSKLANTAIITTPNKARNFNSLTSASPAYYQHVREWTAGEFYWVLRTFYNHVELYSMADIYVPSLFKVGVLTNKTPLIAYCQK